MAKSARNEPRFGTHGDCICTNVTVKFQLDWQRKMHVFGDTPPPLARRARRQTTRESLPLYKDKRAKLSKPQHHLICYDGRTNSHDPANYTVIYNAFCGF